MGPASVTTAKYFFEWHHKLHERAAREGRRFYSISDASLAGRPSPEVRRLFADDVKARAEKTERPDEAEVSSVVLTNRLLRGALTAIGWVAPSMKYLHTAGTMQEALEHIFEEMRADGVTPPVAVEPATYKSPAADDPEATALASLRDAG